MMTMENLSYNILILSSGRRVELVNCFKNAAKNIGINSRIICADCSRLSPSLYFADSYYIVSDIESEQYVEEIINICNSESISLIIPTIDTDLQKMAQNRTLIEKLTNAKLLISDFEVINICRNKELTSDFLLKNGFLVPKQYSYDEAFKPNIHFPLFIKPKSGSSSKGAYKVDNVDQLRYLYEIIEQPIIQEFLDGEEYSVDVFLDFKSTIISIVPRLRIATRCGEISKGRIVKDSEIIETIKKLMKCLNPIGHITVQLMKTQKGIEFIEINPRFGGGAPMSIHSGADSCEYLYRLLLGENIEYTENYRENLTYLRFDRSICLNDDYEVIE